MSSEDKRVSWDADFYAELSDDACLYCLSQKDIYVLGQALQQLQWSTRWTGDISAFDLSAMAGELEFRLVDSKCSDLQQMLFNMQQMLLSIAELRETVENGGVPLPNETVETPYYQYSGQAEPVGGISVPCSTTGEKDALYGGISELVEYIVQSISDLIEIFRNAGTAVPEKLDMLISAIPVYETLPIDDIFGFAAYLAEEVEEVWDATVTVDRLQEFKCKLFCAALANDCTLTPELIMTIIALESPATMGDIVASSIRDTIAIIVAGSPVGDELFYSMIGTILLVVLAGEQWLDAKGWRPYEHRFLSGYNSPDNDWSIFCTACPTILWNDDYRFFDGQGEQGWTAVVGSFTGAFYEGQVTPPSPTNSTAVVQIQKEFVAPYPVLSGVGVIYDKVHECSITQYIVQAYKDEVPVKGWSSSPGSQGIQVRRVDGVSSSLSDVEIDKIVITISSARCSGTDAYARIHGVRLWYDPDSPVKGIATYRSPYGTTSNGRINNSDDWRNWSVL